MPGGVLHEARLVAEAVVAVLPHAVEVCLVLPVVAVRELAILVEPGDLRLVESREAPGWPAQCAEAGGGEK